MDLGSVRAIANSISAVAALGATFLAYRAVRERRFDRRSQQYKSAIWDFVFDEISRFQKEEAGHLERAVCRVQDTCRQELVRHEDVVAVISEESKAFQARLRQLKNAIMLRVEAWENADLTTSVRGCLHSIEDEVVPFFERLSSNSGTLDRGPAESALQHHISNILKAIIRHEPSP